MSKVVPINAAAMAASEQQILDWITKTTEDEILEQDDIDGPDIEGLELMVVHQSKLIRDLRRDLDELFDRFNLVASQREWRGSPRG